LIGKNHSYLSADEFDEFDTAPERSAARSAAEPALRARERAVEEDGDGRLYPKAAPGGRAGDPETYKTDAALRFLSDDDERPFFLWLSYLNPHTPYVAAERWFDVYRDRPVPEPAVEAEGLAAAGKPFRQIYHQENNDAILPFDRETTMTMRRVYYAMVSVIDEEIGRILEYLDKSGRREDTLIVFTSDHGDYMGDHGLLTKSPALYDCLVRVPFILSYPGVLPSGERRDDFVSHVDLLPTLAALSGCSVPAAVHGRDFLKYSGDELRPVAYAEYGIPGRPYDQWSYRQSGYVGRPFRNPGDDRLPWEGNPVSLSGRIRMIRSHRHKLVIEEEGTNELYDLENDPDELVNLASDPAHRGICTELLSSAEPILARLGDAVS
jgi:arylsulfatase A-like enzyme